MSKSKGFAVLKAIAATAELTGTELSEAALLVFEADLAGYPEADVLAALTRCRRELRGRLTIADVLDRMSTAGGHPTANEAWAMALASLDEAQTVVWTDQVAEAAAVARPILEAGDEVGARMAFRDAYERIVRERVDEPRWFPSLGSDAGRRQAALDRAVADGRLRREHVDGLLPPPINAKGHVIAGLLSGDASAPMPLDDATRAAVASFDRDPEFRRRITGLLRQIKGGESA